MKLTGSYNGKDYPIDVPITESEYDYIIADRGEDAFKNTIGYSKSTGSEDLNIDIRAIIEPAKRRAAYLQKYLDKTAEQVKSELRQEFLEKRKNEEAHINKYTDLYTDIKTFNSVLQKEYEDCQTQIEELTDIVYDFQKNLDKTAEQVKEELRQEFLPKNEDEEAHVTIYNNLYTDIKTVDNIYKEKYEQCQTQIEQLIHTLSIHQKKFELLGASRSMDCFDILITVTNLVATYLIVFQIIYILYNFSDITKTNPVIKYTKNILDPMYPTFLGYID
jgi:hypothetical protein